MRGKSALLVLMFVVTLALVVAGCGGDDDEAGGDGGIEIELAAEEGSDESGTATITPAGEGKVKVVVEAENAPSEAQPSHIHEGTCDNPNPQPKYPLSNVEDGTAESTVDTTLDELQSSDYYVNIHKSADEADVIVACGDIPKS
jgi:hypothetical protein